MNRRMASAAVVAFVTLGAIVAAISAGTAALVTLVVIAVGFPTAILLLALSLADPDGTSRPWLSFIMGATIIPILVVASSGLITAVAMLVLSPLSDTGWSVLESLGGDQDLIQTFGTTWVILFLVELAIVAPIVEETWKPLGAIVRRPSSRVEAFSYGMAAGAGFAAVENLVYVSLIGGTIDGWIAVSLARAAGAGLHMLGAGLVALGWHQMKSRQISFPSFLRLYAIAIGIHAAWNGLIGVTLVFYWHQAIAEDPGSALAWGAGLQIMLFMFGVVILAALLLVAHWVKSDDDGVSVLGFAEPGSARTVTVWAALAAALLIPTAILLLVFPAATI